MYYIGQALGVVSAVCSLILPMLKKKSQMLVMTMFTNGLVALNLVMIGEFGSAVLIHSLAVVQAMVTLRHIRRDTPVTRRENVIFFVLYIACGLLGYHRPLDILPIVSSLFNMAATFQRDVHKTRVLILINVSTFLIYYLIVGSTSALMVGCTIITTVIAMLRDRKKR